MTIFYNVESTSATAQQSRIGDEEKVIIKTLKEEDERYWNGLEEEC